MSSLIYDQQNESFGHLRFVAVRVVIGIQLYSSPVDQIEELIIDVLNSMPANIVTRSSLHIIDSQGPTNRDGSTLSRKGYL